MSDSKKSIARDGRLTVVLLLLSGILIFDLGKGDNFFSSGKYADMGSCLQLHHVKPKSLVVENCLETGEGLGKQAVPGRFSPFLFAAIPINSADKELLMTVNGIGPALADDIIAYRRQFGHFTSGRDLLVLPGIGPKRAAKFAEAFTFTGKP